MSDLEDDYDYFPMWTKVLDPQESLKHVEQNIRPGGSFYYFNNFNGQTQTTPPTSEYTPALDDNYKNEKLVFRDMPIDMSQLFASKRLQTIARARTARKRIRRIKGDNKFNRFYQQTRKQSTVLVSSRHSRRSLEQTLCCYRGRNSSGGDEKKT